MKNWALSACIARMAKDPETRNDASLTASAFLENSQQDLEDFEQLGKLVDDYLALQYGGSVKSDYNTMKCIDLFHSRKLDQLASRLVKRR
ncbi:T6SS amidase immunity protein Tai4 family protein [Uliginosibacterium paludis]|uniref:T6SS amidase immunity protein Tai4 family protein n=1 Tax=Uliginosibacterium paludis TaxID=1615952 RepID=A0ABV2CVN5_9RHOO